MTASSQAEPEVSPQPAWLAALHRYGGFLVAPRKTLAVAPGDGHRDGLWLGVLYLVGTSIYPLAEAAATLVALHNLGALIGVFSILGRALLVPILVVVAAEVLLGPGRAHRRGLALVPLVLMGTLLHAGRQVGMRPPGGELAWTIAAAFVGASLLWWAKSSIEPRREDEDAGGKGGRA